MGAEPRGQYFHTAILQKTVPIQNSTAFQSLRGTHHRRPKAQGLINSSHRDGTGTILRFAHLMVMCSTPPPHRIL